MLREGEWRGTKEFRGIASFHISELYSPWSTWADMAVAFVEAKRFPETLQTWINTALGETFEERGEEVESVGLAARREQYDTTTIPSGVLMLTAGVDVQDDRLEATVVGYGRDEETWVIEHHVLRGDPGSESLWRDLDNWLLQKRTTDDGRTLLIEAAGIDSGGHFTQQVYGYAAKRKARRVWAIKGAGGFGRLIWPKRAGRAGRTSAQVFIVGVDTAKDVLFGRLKRIQQPGAGYVHFANSLDEVYFDQLTAETLVHRMVQGRRVRSYRPRTSGSRTEALDCLVYAYAAFIGRQGPMVLPNRKSNEKPVEQPVAVTPVVESPNPIRRRLPSRPRGGGGGWVNGWR